MILNKKFYKYLKHKLKKQKVMFKSYKCNLENIKVIYSMLLNKMNIFSHIYEKLLSLIKASQTL
jgi:hypothetical protein